MNNNNNPNNSQLETHLQKAMETIRTQKSQLEDMNNKLRAQDDIIVSLKDQMIPKSTGTALKRPSSIRK